MTATSRDPLARFSDRVAHYVRYRPSYPAQVVSFLERELPLSDDYVVADIGSGTGILSRLFLDAGREVYGVEPNAEMAAAAVELLRDYPRFHPVDGRAEASGLEPASVDLAVVGQAFHWFDPERTRAELLRVTRPPGRVAIIWNLRRFDTPFLSAYEDFLRRWGTDYKEISQGYADVAALTRLFGRDDYRRHDFENAQRFDLDGLVGRVLSSSYMPAAGDPRQLPMLEALGTLYAEHAAGGEVVFDYDTQLYYGALTAA